MALCPVSRKSAQCSAHYKDPHPGRGQPRDLVRDDDPAAATVDPDVPDPRLGQADHMAAVTTVMRVQQLLLSRVEDTLKPYGPTFAACEALRLLAFSRRGSLPMGKIASGSWSTPPSVTNVITRLEHRGLVERRLSPDDRRVVLATITPDGQALVREATEALKQASFGAARPHRRQAAEVTSTLRALRVAGGDAAAGTRMPPAVTGDREPADRAGDPDRHRP